METSDSTKARHVQPFAFMSSQPVALDASAGPSFAEYVAARNQPELPVSATHPSLVGDVPEDIA